MSSIRERYRNDGFYFPVDVMGEAEAMSHYDRLVEIEALHGTMHYRVKPYLVCLSAFEIATHPRLLDKIEAILGPNILLWDSSYIIKEPNDPGFVSWHQDLTYWGLELTSDYDLVSAWLALSPATRASGCMQFVRGSHKRGRLDHNDTHDENNLLHRGQEVATDFPPDAIVHGELSPGQASLHQGWTVHASSANRSAERRVGLVMNYTKPSVKQIVGGNETATLVRGCDDFRHFGTEPNCVADFAADNVRFQLEAQHRKREVYDTA